MGYLTSIKQQWWLVYVLYTVANLALWPSHPTHKNNGDLCMYYILWPTQRYDLLTRLIKKYWSLPCEIEWAAGQDGVRTESISQDQCSSSFCSDPPKALISRTDTQSGSVKLWYSTRENGSKLYQRRILPMIVPGYICP